MANEIDLTMQNGVRRAMAWFNSHSGRDACDAATTAVMQDSHPTAHGLGQHLWPEFLDHVKKEVADAEPPF